MVEANQLELLNYINKERKMTGHTQRTVQLMCQD